MFSGGRERALWEQLGYNRLMYWFCFTSDNICLLVSDGKENEIRTHESDVLISKKTLWSFFMDGFNNITATGALRGDRSSPGVPGTHLIVLGRRKGCDLGVTQQT